MSEDTELGSSSLFTTEDAFDKFQAVSMYEEDEYITLSDIEPTQALAPKLTEVYENIPYEDEVVLDTVSECDSQNVENPGVDTTSATEPSPAATVPQTETSTSLAHSNEAEVNPSASKLNKTSTKRGRKKKDTSNSLTSVDNNVTKSKCQNINTLKENEDDRPMVESRSRRGRKSKSELSVTSSEVQNIEWPEHISETLEEIPVESTLINLNQSEITACPVSKELEDDNVLNKIIEKPKKRGRKKKSTVCMPDVSVSNISDQQIDSLTSVNSSDLDHATTPIKRGRRKRKTAEQLTEQILTDEPKEQHDLQNLTESADKNPKEGNADNITSSQLSIKKNKRGRKKVPKDNDNKSHAVEKNVEPFDQPKLLSDNCGADDDQNDDISLSKLKQTIDTNDVTDNLDSNTNVEDMEIEEQLMAIHGVHEAKVDTTNDTPSKRTSKTLFMSDFEYNIDTIVCTTAVTENDNDQLRNDLEGSAEESLLEKLGNDHPVTQSPLEDTGKRPVRRKAKQNFHYDEGSDEDPFANVELSDDDEPRRKRRGNRYYSDEEYEPWKEQGPKKSSSDNTDSDIDENLDTLKKKKKLRKTSAQQKSPKKKIKTDQTATDIHVNTVVPNDSCSVNDDIEICLESSVIKKNDENEKVGWGASNEFENFIAKKIHGTELKIKKVSSTNSTETVITPLQIPVIDQNEQKKTVEMSVQTNIVSTSSIAIQTTTPYEAPMKENIALTSEQSEKACEFLKNIVKTTSELGNLMTEKSEDFITKKINTDHVTDTFKMDYCVRKSFLLFKLAKHNLMQMEEDLSKQYEEFLKANKLLEFREEPKKLSPKPAPVSSDSDCEIVEEPIKVKQKEKPKFNPKTVFLNKELSIKIAKKPIENKSPKKDINVKGKHTVWINNSIMVKKVKPPTQSFLAQDSRNKKPPDTYVTSKMVKDFFNKYYKQKVMNTCATLTESKWLNTSINQVCNYFVVQSDKFPTESNFSGNSDTYNENSANNNAACDMNWQKYTSNVSCPQTLFSLCANVVQKSINSNVSNVTNFCESDKLADTEKKQYLYRNTKDLKTLFRLSLNVLNNLPNENLSPEIEQLPKIMVPTKALSLKTLCYKKIIQLCYANSLVDANAMDYKSPLYTTCNQLIINRIPMITKSDMETETHLYTTKSTEINSNFKITPELLQANSNLSNIIENEHPGKGLSNFQLTIDKEIGDELQQIIDTVNKNGIKSLFSLCVNLLQKQQTYIHRLYNKPIDEKIGVEPQLITETINKNGIKSLFSLCVNLLQKQQTYIYRLDNEPIDEEIGDKPKLITKTINTNGIKSLFSLCLNLLQKQQTYIYRLDNNPTFKCPPKSLKLLTLENINRIILGNFGNNLHCTIITKNVKRLSDICFDVVSKCMFDNTIINKTNEHTINIEALTINSINTLSEEAFYSIDESGLNDTESPYFRQDDENSDYIEDDFDHFNDYPENNDISECEENWVAQVQMKELKSCFMSTNTNDTRKGDKQNSMPAEKPTEVRIKLEPIEENCDNTVVTTIVKTEPVNNLDEMTLIPENLANIVKGENIDYSDTPEQVQRRDSNSYDVEAFETFVRTNKMMQSLDEIPNDNEEIFSQSALRIRRQFEPDYDNEYETGIGNLLIPHTYEPMNVGNAKDSLMESSSDETGTSKKNNMEKKKGDKKSKRKAKKVDAKQVNKDSNVSNKEKITSGEVANLTKKMRERIRQEEKKLESSDSENELHSLHLRKTNKKDSSEKQKLHKNNKSTQNEIQVNDVDSTEQINENVLNKKTESFSGFSAIDQNEMSTYQKYVKYVYEKIISKDQEDETVLASDSKKNQSQVATDEISRDISPVISPDEPVELLECEPSLPQFEDDEFTKNNESVEKIAQIYNNLLKEPIIVNKTETKVDEVLSYTDRHGWKCYQVDSNDIRLYQTAHIPLEKLPETFVETYFKYQNITYRSKEDEEVNRLINLQTLNRVPNIKDVKIKRAKEKTTDGQATPTNSSQPASPANNDNFDELSPSEDEGETVNQESLLLVSKQSNENNLAKNSLMDDKDSDTETLDVTKKKIKEEPKNAEMPKKKYKPGPKSRKVNVEEEKREPNEMMLTADKMMNKELSLLHAPAVLKEEVIEPVPLKASKKIKLRSVKRFNLRSRLTAEDDSSSEEEKQWVNTKEKLLKKLGKKQDTTSVDDAKRTKLVSQFIERRTDDLNTRKGRGLRMKRSSKKRLERQKQLRFLSKELYGESSAGSKSGKNQALFKGRRNIRKVIDKKSLAKSTLIANFEEFERKRRLNIRQNRLRELLGYEEGVNVLVINDEVCLEYDFEELRPVVTIHPFFTKVMKAHQYEGVKFMWDACFENLEKIEEGHPGGGCILAHCMGLGKTLQVLALLHTVLTHPRVGMQRVLVCCPLSTVLNWVDEIHKWIGPVTDQIKVFELSKLKKTYERAYQLEDWYNGGGIFIIGYELFRSLTTLDPEIDDVRTTVVNKIRTALLDPGPDIIVCDEGHLLKNDCSVLAVAMSRVTTKRRILLTGTPIQNNLREYYCMVNFIKPNLLGTYAEYSNRFENPIMNGQHRDSREEDIKLMKARTHILHKVLEGCLQRQEASVLYPYLPKKHEYTVFISLTKCQCDLYKHYLDNYALQSKQNILKDFHILQKIWSHPRVLHNFQMRARGNAEANRVKVEKLEDDLAREDLTAREDLKPIDTEVWWLQYLDGGNMLDSLQSSNKFVAVFRILEECVALGDKVLIFSTSLFSMDALEYFLKTINKWSLGQEYYRLDGSVPPEVRQKWCREFNAENNLKTKLFLISTRAGCLGLNMTAANRVIILDTSWNPAHDIQSIFRVYRFGQKKDCFIYRLVALGTMEQKIYERSVTKQAVACRVVDEQQIERHYNSAELTELYRFDSMGSGVAGGVAVGVRDVALLRVARDAALHAVHEHDSLLRGCTEQGLPEHERAAAWMQFQQEHGQKHMQIMTPNVATPSTSKTKRSHGHDYAKSPSVLKVENIKEEDTSKDADYNPSEPKPKKGKKQVVNCKIPIQQTEDLNSQSSLIKEELMVKKITDILIKHNFQNRQDQKEISALVANVRRIVASGQMNKIDSADELTLSIAKVLLENEAGPSTSKDVVPEKARGKGRPRKTTAPLQKSAPIIESQCEIRTRRKAALAAEKQMDSFVKGSVIEINDNSSRNSYTEFITDDIVPNHETEPRPIEIVKEKEKTKAIKQTRRKVYASPKEKEIVPSLKEKEIVPSLKEKEIVPSLKDKEIVTPVVDSVDHIEILSDSDSPPPVIETKKNKIMSIDSIKKEKVVKVHTKESGNIPMPPSLLTNQNFIKIVAHTYLAGNSSLDEDAAMLAAQYSTSKALQEIEITGKILDSGPIYDIALKVLGIDILRKLHQSSKKSANNQNAISKESTKASVETLTSKPSTSSKDSEETVKIYESKSKPKIVGPARFKAKKLADLMGKDESPKPGFTNLVDSLQESVITEVTPRTGQPSVVPVGLFKTSSNVPSNSADEECILPDDDDIHIISDPPRPAVQKIPFTTNNTPIPVSTTALSTAPSTSTYKRRKSMPFILKSITSANTKTTVAKSPAIQSTSLYSEQTVLNIAPNQVKGRLVLQLSQVAKSNSQKDVASTPEAPQVQTVSNDTICLDSDDEDTIVPTLTPAKSIVLGNKKIILQPIDSPLVPVSLTAANPMMVHTANSVNNPQIITSSSSTHNISGLQSNQLATEMQSMQKLGTPNTKFMVMSHQSKPKTTSSKKDIPDKEKETMVSAVKVANVTEKSVARDPENATRVVRQVNLPKTIQIQNKSPPVTFIAQKSILDLTEMDTLINTVKHDKSQVKFRITNKGRLELLNEDESSNKTANTPSKIQKPTLTTPKPSDSTKPIALTRAKSSAQRARNISLSSSSSSSRASSPVEDPLSILKDVVHIQAADEPKTRLVSDTTKPSVTKSVQSNKPLRSLLDKAVDTTKKTVTNTKAPLNKQYSVRTHTASTSKTNDENVTLVSESVDLTADYTVVPIKTYIKPKSGVIDIKDSIITVNSSNKKFDKKKEVSTTIVGTSKNIILSGSGISKSITKVSTPIKSDPSAATVTARNVDRVQPFTLKSVDSKKRSLTVTESSPPKKMKPNKPLTLKDFNLDDIDDIIELD